MGGWATPKAAKMWRDRNREKIAAQSRAAYKRNPQRRLEVQRKSRARLDAIVYAAKRVPCKDCGNVFPECAMQFDHVRGEKIADIAQLRSRGNLQKLLDEIAKCDIVCANCHAVRTCLRDCRPKARQCKHVKQVLPAPNGPVPILEAKVEPDHSLPSPASKPSNKES